MLRLDVARFNKFSGLSYKGKQSNSYIEETLVLRCMLESEKNVTFNIPSHRFDISLEEDLYEELLRSYGYDNIPTSKPKAGPITNNKKNNALGNLRLGSCSFWL